MRGFFRKLRQRNVIKVGIAYLIISWAVMQLADVILPLLQLPEWTITLVLALLVLGFPIALVLAWAYEITPDGIQRDPDLKPLHDHPRFQAVVDSLSS